MSLGGVSIAPIERYLATLWERGGSDLLITAFSPPLMRIDGQLIPIPGEPELDQDHVEHLVLGVLTDDLKTELRTEPRGRLLVLLQEGRALPRATASSRWARSRWRCA